MSDQTKNVVSIKNFSKKFGNVSVINNLSFDVKEGEIFVFLGANGSGKTTTIRCLLGIYEANYGELLINGSKYDIEQSTLLGYLPEERGLYVTSKVLETLIYFGRLKGMSKADASKKGKEYLQRVGLGDKENSKIKQLSSGQQQKIQLGITVINTPKLLILDEPTKGLDPVNRSLLMEILLELNKSGSTIMFSTHQMDEAEKVANTLLMLKDGKAALYGHVDDIKKQFGNNTIHINFSGKFELNEKLFSIMRLDQNYAELVPNVGKTSTDVLDYFVSRKLEISKFEVTSPSLNEIFIKVSNLNEK